MGSATRARHPELLAAASGAGGGGARRRSPLSSPGNGSKSTAAGARRPGARVSPPRGTRPGRSASRAARGAWSAAGSSAAARTSPTPTEPLDVRLEAAWMGRSCRPPRLVTPPGRMCFRLDIGADGGVSGPAGAGGAALESAPRHGRSRRVGDLGHPRPSRRRRARRDVPAPKGPPPAAETVGRRRRRSSAPCRPNTRSGATSSPESLADSPDRRAARGRLRRRPRRPRRRAAQGLRPRLTRTGTPPRRGSWRI